jgi:hypothetical protein
VVSYCRLGAEGAVADQIGNEKLKLTCMWINGLSLAIFAAGVVLPVVNLLVGSSQSGPGPVAVLCGICLIVTVSIHLWAKRMLGEFDDSD